MKPSSIMGKITGRGIKLAGSADCFVALFGRQLILQSQSLPRTAVGALEAACCHLHQVNTLKIVESLAHETVL
jgi:hypothetical protein